jgi:hypothetical protein
MELLAWLPAVSTSVLLLMLCWLCRNLIATRLTASVAHEFNNKLERLKSDLSAKQAEIDALRSGALTALASRQVTLDKRKLDAIDQLWAGVTDLNRARVVVHMMFALNYEAAAEEAHRKPEFRAAIKAMGGGFDPLSLKTADTAMARPYVPVMVWAIFTALIAITMHGVMRWMVLKEGLAKKDLTSVDAVNRLIKAALPHWSEYLDEHGAKVYPEAMAALDELLLTEIRAALNGNSAEDEATVARAAEILKTAELALKKSQLS